MNLGRESEQLEFKETTSELDNALIDICAILNKHGSGTLYFGVKDNGDVIGFQVGKNTENDISNSIYNHIEPKIYPTIELLQLDGKDVIKITFSGNNLPYANDGRHYIRTSDDSRLMSEHELVNFIRRIDYSATWEDQLTNYTYNDIDDTCLKNFFNAARQFDRLSLDTFNKEELMVYLGLVNNGRINKAGYYLFGKNVRLNLKLSIYATKTKTKLLDATEVKGNIYTLVNQALRFIFSSISYTTVIRLKREETPEIPEAAIREIVINSFAHAQYESSTEHEISVYRDRVEVYNPGTFPLNLTPIDFINTNRRSIIRNKLISDVLFRSKDVEKGGSGFRRVYECCSAANVKWDYMIDDYGFAFIFYRKNSIALSEPENTEIVVEELDYLTKQVYELIKAHPETKKHELAHAIKMSEKTVQRCVANLRKKGYIERVGNYMSGYWKVLK